jgi:tRNA-specific 2-thiouridylase
MGERVYVVGKDTAKNILIVGPEEALYRRELIASDFNWLSIPEPRAPIRAAARTRYHQTEHPATVFPLPEGQVKIVFDEPQRAITPGQAVVLYDGELVLGGGTIMTVGE